MGVTVSSYVHSNIEHGHWKKFNGYETPRLLAEESDVNAAIKRLEAVKKDLEEEADKFLDGGGIEALNYCVDNEYNLYSQIAVKILQESDAITALLQGNVSEKMHQKDVEKLVKFIPEELKPQIEKILNIENISETTVKLIAEQIAAAISDSDGVIVTHKSSKFSIPGINTHDFIKGLIADNKNFFDDLDINATLKIEQDYTGKRPGDITNLKKGGKKNEVVTAIENIIKKRGLYQSANNQEKQFKDSIASFMHWFEGRFNAEIKNAPQLVAYEKKDSPKQYLEDFESKLRDIFKKGKVPGNTMNIVGALGDEFYVTAYQVDPLTAEIKIVSVSTTKEKNVVKEYGDAFKGLKTLHTHHDSSKQSQTDILIQNKKGKTVRVQAKNASLANQEFENKGLINLNAHLERSKQLAELLYSLNFPNVEETMYTVVNALWFGSHDSISGIRDIGKLNIEDGGGDSQILSQLTQDLSRYISLEAENFLGITLQEASTTEQTIIAGASNIFYLKNGRLIPTYALVDEVIKDLKNYYNTEASKLHGLRFTVQGAKKISWEYEDAIKFWTAKAENDFANAQAVGLAQGTLAASSIVVDGEFPKVSSLVVNVNS